MRWDLIEEAHVPLQIEMNIAALNDNEVVQKTVGIVKCDIDPEDIDCDIGEVHKKAEAIYGAELANQLEQGRVNEAHVTWNKMAEITYLIIQGEEEDEARRKVEKNWWRGSVPKFKKRQRI